MYRMTVSIALAGVVLASLACGPHPPSHEMLDGWVGEATRETVKEELGMPSMSLPLADGTTEWLYRVGYEAVLQDNMGSANEVCWRYTFTFDTDGVLEQWRRERCQSSADPLERIREESGRDDSGG